MLLPRELVLSAVLGAALGTAPVTGAPQDKDAKTNQTDPTQTLAMTTSAPASVVLTNSGFPGVNFSIGGSVTLNSTTSGGTYVGTFNVTVDYQ